MIKPVCNNAQRVNHQNFAKKTHTCAKKNLVPRAVLMKSGLVSINTARQNISKTAVLVNTARQVNVAHSKTTVNAARPMSYLSKTAHSTIKRPIHKNTTFKNSNINQRVNTVRGKNVNTARPKAVVNACINHPKKGNPQMDLQDKGVIDSGCSRHMIGNMSYLADYEEIDRGYVAFRGNPKGGKIIGKVNAGDSKSMLPGINLLLMLKVNAARHNLLLLVTVNAVEVLVYCQSQTVNGEVQLHALVDGKKIIITESTMRRDLQLEDAEGVDCLPNSTIFEQLTLMGRVTFDLVAYIDSDYAGASLDRKSTIGGIKLNTVGKVNVLGTNLLLLGKVNAARHKLTTAEEIAFLLDMLKVVGLEQICGFFNVTHYHFANLPKCLRDNAWNEYSNTMALAISARLTNHTFNFSSHFESMVKNLENMSGKFLMYPKFVQDVNEEMDDSLKRAATTATGLDAEQDGELLTWRLKDDQSSGDYNVWKTESQEVREGNEVKESKRLYKVGRSGSMGDDIMFDVSDSCCEEEFGAEQRVPDISVASITDVKITLAQALAELKSAKPTTTTSTRSKAKGLRIGKGFSGKETPLFPTMVVQNQAEMGKGSAIPTNPHHTPTIIQPSASQPLKKQRSRRPKRKDTKVPQPSGPTDNVADKVVYKERDDSLERAVTTATGLDAQDRGGGPRRQETMGDTIAQTRSENVSKLSNDPLLARGNTLQSGEDRLKLQELMKLCTNLQNRVINLENTKTAQAQEITRGCIQIGEEIDGIDKDAEITLVDETQGSNGDNIMFDVSDLAGEEVFVVEQGVPDSKKDDVAQVNTAATTISTASTIPVSAALITDVEITLAQALAELKSAKPTTATSTRPKAKGLVIHEQEQAPTPIVSSQQPSQAKIQDKGKAKMIEPEPVKKLSKKDQLKLDEEVAQRLQAEFDEQERIEREKAEANIALKETWDDIQAKIEADCLLAERLQAREQEELTIEERAILFQQLLEKRRKHFAAKRAEEKRNRPPTKAQQRSIMCTYLKNIEGWKPKDLGSIYRYSIVFFSCQTVVQFVPL
ncbi:hypothetical protein Tco_0877738 [Tanacetum coccineum]|uniref:Uncharacterized protein n=1 Tax=Tanacetum coccineum TaxID=301880 RepID=A0ABQ5BZ15_9ASTR